MRLNQQKRANDASYFTIYTTNDKILIDYIYSSITGLQINLGVLETYFGDHKARQILQPVFYYAREKG